MNPFSAIMSVIGGGLSVAAEWFKGYGNQKTTKAREISDDNAKKDEFNKALQSGDLDAVRKRLS